MIAVAEVEVAVDLTVVVVVAVVALVAVDRKAVVAAAEVVVSPIFAPWISPSFASVSTVPRS